MSDPSLKLRILTCICLTVFSLGTLVGACIVGFRGEPLTATFIAIVALILARAAQRSLPAAGTDGPP